MRAANCRPCLIHTWPANRGKHKKQKILDAYFSVGCTVSLWCFIVMLGLDCWSMSGVAQVTFWMLAYFPVVTPLIFKPVIFLAFPCLLSRHVSRSLHWGLPGSRIISLLSFWLLDLSGTCSVHPSHSCRLVVSNVRTKRRKTESAWGGCNTRLVRKSWFDAFIPNLALRLSSPEITHSDLCPSYVSHYLLDDIQELDALVFLFKERRNHWLRLSYCVA